MTERKIATIMHSTWWIGFLISLPFFGASALAIFLNDGNILGIVLATVLALPGVMALSSPFRHVIKFKANPEQLNALDLVLTFEDDKLVATTEHGGDHFFEYYDLKIRERRGVFQVKKKSKFVSIFHQDEITRGDPMLLRMFLETKMRHNFTSSKPASRAISAEKS